MNEIFLFGFILVLAIFFVFMLLKENENNKKFTRYEKTLEAIMQENFLLKKEISKLQPQQAQDIDINAIQNRILSNINAIIDEKLANFTPNLIHDNGGYDVEVFDEIQERLFRLEGRSRELNKMVPNEQSQKDQIIKMFNNGKSVEQIAKDMRLGIGWVETILRLNNQI
ncbi:MAG: hypothetical protein K5978_08670 [Campylobacter sp.]|nr:hypothetical protein [Campylobacter sp.]